MNASLFGTPAAEPQNDFKPFAVGTEANVIEQTEYEKATFLKDGFKKGIARSFEINKAIRQGSSIAAAVARFTADGTGENILDNGDIETLSRQIRTAIGNVSSLLIAEAEGTAEAIVARFTPAVKELKNGLLVHVRANTANSTRVPTFSVDDTGEKPVVKGNNLPLESGDIAGAGHWLEMQYDKGLDKWVLQNPAKGITPQSGVPVGTVEYFATTTPPAGYLKADGSAVGRETYVELFAAIGTTFGEGDGETTFNLPDLIDRFAQGGGTPGQKLEAGVPNIEGSTGRAFNVADLTSGAFKVITAPAASIGGTPGITPNTTLAIDASHSSPIYGASDTVQPPALTLLPCIKAFDAATNPGLVDVTELANEMAGKVDRLIDGKPVRYVIDACNDGTNWYRKWSDGWLEQGATIESNMSRTASLLVPFATANYIVVANQQVTQNIDSRAIVKTMADTTTTFFLDVMTVSSVASQQVLTCNYYACGQGA